MARTADWIREFLRRAALRESRCELVDHSAISRSSVMPRRGGLGQEMFLDSQREQVGESRTRLRMPAEGSRWKWQEGRSRANLRNTTCFWTISSAG
jgi:hypothetical protein